MPRRREVPNVNPADPRFGNVEAVKFMNVICAWAAKALQSASSILLGSRNPEGCPGGVSSHASTTSSPWWKSSPPWVVPTTRCPWKCPVYALRCMSMRFLDQEAARKP